MKRQIARIRNQPSKRESQWRILMGLVVTVIIMASLFAYAAYGSRNNTIYRSTAAELRILVLQMINHATHAMRAQSGSFEALGINRGRFQQSLQYFKTGFKVPSAPPSADLAPQEFARLETSYASFDENVGVVLNSEKVVGLLNEFATSLGHVMPEILELNESVNRAILSSDLRTDTKHLAARQLLLGERIATNANRLIIGGRDNARIASAFRADTEEFNRVLRGFLDGNAKAGIPAISNRHAREQLYAVLPLFETVHELAGRILEKSPDLIKAQNAAREMTMISEALLISADDLRRVFSERDALFNFVRMLAFLCGVVVVIFVGLLAISFNRDTGSRLLVEQQKNQQHQAAILQLLDEISPVAQGDLTTRATVSEAITGAIADAINLAIEALRELVISIHKMAGHVAETAQETQATTLHLARASEKQSAQVAEVSKAVALMAQGTETLARQAKDSANLARQASTVAEQGGIAVTNSITGIETVRNDIRDTAIRIKRLGESSQAIGDIAEIIDGIAEQTQILALNAAIQAAAAGAQGLGFSNVADEMQQLAEWVTMATQKIESLIQSIQIDTNDAIDSMERSMADSNEGARLAEIAGSSLKKIEAVTQQLTQFNQQVAGASKELTETANQIVINMDVINQLAQQNLAGAQQSAKLNDQLANLAVEQGKAVAKFKLPNNQEKQA